MLGDIHTGTTTISYTVDKYDMADYLKSGKILDKPVLSTNEMYVNKQLL